MAQTSGTHSDLKAPSPASSAVVSLINFDLVFASYLYSSKHISELS